VVCLPVKRGVLQGVQRYAVVDTCWGKSSLGTVDGLALVRRLLIRGEGGELQQRTAVIAGSTSRLCG
jgi:hypothetical protein